VLHTSLAHRPSSAPRLEFFQQGSDELQSVLIERTPFKIGRCETSDLRIDSVEVSREHAQIFRRGSIWIIRDLGSTNGTKVNGKPIRESFLSDGDLLAIAETEVSFVAASVTPIQRMATQPIQPRESSKPTALMPPEIAHLRALTEATLSQAVALQLATATLLESGETEACFAHLCEAAAGPESDLRAFHAVGEMYREVCQYRAIELALAQGVTNRIVVSAEIVSETPQQMLPKIDRLKDHLPANCELGISISLAKINDTQALDQMCREVCQAELLLACTGFQGSGVQVLELESCAPDYLALSETMLRGVTAGSQPARRLEQVLTACQRLGIKAVLPLCSCERTVAHCRQMGYELGLQTTTPADSLAACSSAMVLTN